MRSVLKVVLLSGFVSLFSTQAIAADVFSTKNVGMEMARDLASEAVLACRKAGYHVSAVVVDRHATTRAALRDDLAARFTIDIAERKANTAVMAGVDSSTWRNSVIGAKPRSGGDIRMEMNSTGGIIMLDGGVLIDSGGNRIGAIGVSGAPGGDKDEACAKAALKKLDERLQFAE